MRYLLDTNIVSSLYADPFGPAAERASRSDATELGTSIIVAAELRYGYVKKNSKRLEHLIETTLGSLTVVGWDGPADMA
jgi:tRNA(fMet)-specific endonuclease VapC